MNAAPSQRAGFRPDIEGLRAIAIVLVLLYHAGIPGVTGGFIGVDVFFVISGFLITGLLIRELERSGRISLPRFYARRAKRLLPAAGLVLAVTAGLTWWAIPQVHWRTFGGDILGSATYVVNWVLAARSVDYLAEDVGASPVQHFWSLAVEEQFYILWPLLLVAVGWWIRKHSSTNIRRVMTIALFSVIIPSFIWSILLTATDPQTAFFITPTRLWQLGVGALVAIGLQRWEALPRRVGHILTTIGVVAIVASGVLVTAATPWPGYAALAPTIGTALVIVGGTPAPTAGVGRVLGSAPAVWIGGLSYSLYLWHWPLLIAAAYRWGDLTPVEGLGIVALSFVPAWLGYVLLENPVRYARSVSASNSLALSLGGNFSLIGVAAGLVLMLAVPPASGPVTPQYDLPQGQDVGTVESLDDVDWFFPTPEEATKSVPASYAEGCQQDQQNADLTKCEWGDRSGTVTLAVVGDSKIVQWESALETIAARQGWKLDGYIKSACGFSAGHLLLDDGRPYESCYEWNRAVLEELLREKPDAVLVSSRARRALDDPADPDSLSEGAMVDALAEQWGALSRADIPVIVLLDNPSPGMSVYQCVGENPDDLATCTFDRERGIAESGAPVQTEAAQSVPGTEVVDMTDQVCPAEQCVPVMGNILVYRQGSHLTDAFIKALTVPLEERLVPAMERATARDVNR